MFRVRVLREQIELSDPGVLGSLGRPAVLTMADVTAVEVVPKPLWTSVVTIYGLGFKWTKSVPDYVAEAFRGAVLEVRPDLARAS
jgi:hypothetical protein